MQLELHLRPEDIVSQRYKIIRPLGEGGFAKVFQAQDLEMGRMVALKILKFSHSEGEKERFQREARLLSRLMHPNLVSVYAFDFITEEAPFIVMEYLEGQPLGSFMGSKEKLDEQLFEKIFLQVCSGLGHIHDAGIVHRDMSPSNIFILAGQSELRVKIIDFGLSKAVASETRLTQTGMLMGNPSYISPELVRGEKIDQRADIYALGCIMYECLSGKCPLQSDTPMGTLYLQQTTDPMEPEFDLKDKNKEDALKAIVLRCLQKDPALRFQTCAELTEALQSNKCGADILDAGGKRNSIRFWANTQAAVRNNNVIKIVSLLLILLIAVSGGVFLWRKSTKTQVAHELQSTVTKDPALQKIELAKRELKERERVLGFNNPKLAEQLEDIAYRCHVYGRNEIQTAESMYKHALSIREKQADSVVNLTADCAELGNLYQTTNRFEQAEIYFKKGLEISQKRDLPLKESTFLEHLSTMANYNKDWKTCESYLKRALVLREKELSKTFLGVRQLTNAGLAVADRPGFEKMFDVVTDARDLAIALNNQGKYVESEALNKRILAKCRNCDAEFRELLDFPLVSLSESYEKQGKFDKAIPYRQESLPISSTKFEVIPKSEKLEKLAEDLRAIGNEKEADKYFADAGETKASEKAAHARAKAVLQRSMAK